MLSCKLLCYFYRAGHLWSVQDCVKGRAKVLSTLKSHCNNNNNNNTLFFLKDKWHNTDLMHILETLSSNKSIATTKQLHLLSLYIIGLIFIELFLSLSPPKCAHFIISPPPENCWYLKKLKIKMWARQFILQFILTKTQPLTFLSQTLLEKFRKLKQAFVSLGIKEFSIGLYHQTTPTIYGRFISEKQHQLIDLYCHWREILASVNLNAVCCKLRLPWLVN